ncbi:M23 family metallopeptidase, partial [Streptococcus pneumoniae]|uniref:M23 family metallopeptidase n=2 Tax=Bacillati TaxID=1783272 RepID=UPI001CF6E72A
MKVTELYEPDGCVFAVANTEPKFGFGFCHLNKIDVHAGQTLKRGDIIGTEGNKGDSVGSLFITHLHFEIYKP